MKQTTKLFRAVGLTLILACSGTLYAQNASYDANAVPIGGSNNCAFGSGVLISTGGGIENSAIGWQALTSNAGGNHNAANGSSALYSNIGGNSNVANGFSALFSNMFGNDNVANGHNALYSNTHGENNVANGHNALFSNVNGMDNTATGHRSLYSNTQGNNNVACGHSTLSLNTMGGHNTAIGFDALRSNTTGARNTGVGATANVSTGTLYNATALGYGAIVNANNKVRIGNTAVTVIEGQVMFTTSDGRFKSNIKEEDVKGLEFIKKLRPVVYNFEAKKLTEFWTKNMPDSIRQHHLDQDFSAATKTRQSGFIAQEVEQAAKEAQYDFNGIHVPESQDDYYSLAYGQFVVPLVKAVQEQQKIIETLQQQVSQLLQEKTTTTTSLEETTTAGAGLEQNVPNPFSNETVIAYSMPQQVNKASLVVYDLSGKQLKSLPLTQRGEASVTLSADQLAAGMYIYSIVADGKILSSKRMVVAEK